MSGLVDAHGRPLSTENFRKEKPTAVGPAFGQWAGRDTSYNQMPGGSVLQFNLDLLTMDDYRAMRYHPQLNACLSVLTFMLHQVDWHLECPEDPEMAQELEDIMRPTWTRLVRALSQSFWAGYSPIAIEYENDVLSRRVVISKFKDLIPEECSVHWKEVESSYNPPQSQRNPTGEGFENLANAPGYAGSSNVKFKVFDGIDQRGLPYTIPPENSLWYPLLMENGNYYGRKLLKAAFTPWYFSTLIHLFANRYFERFGEPVPIGRAPFDDDFVQPDGSVVTGKEAMEQILMNLRNRSVVVLPNDIIQGSRIAGDKTAFEYSVDYLESQMRGADFERYLTRLDEEMSLALFTPLLLLRNADVGSHNLGVQHTQTWLWMLNALTGDMGEYITRYPVQRLKAYNFSPRAPWVKWVPRKMGKENTETLRTIVSGLISGNKIMPDIEELGESLGMTLREVKEVTSDTDENAVAVSDELPEASDGPRGVGEPRATGREISARVRSQVQKAFRTNSFGAGFEPDLGFHKRFIHSLIAEGFAGDKAESITNEFYERTERWLNDAIGIGQESYSSPADFMALFERFIDHEIGQLCR